MKKIKEYFAKNFKKILFIIIFIIFCAIHNLNIQSLNYILKRGAVLEYSCPKDIVINKEEIKNKLANLNIKYSLIESADVSKEEFYDGDEKLIEQTFYIALPYLPKEDKVELFNNVSDYIFDNYKNAKLLNVKLLNDNYSKPYSGFLKFLGILFCALFVWYVVLSLIYTPKETALAFIKDCKNTINSIFQELISLIKEILQCIVEIAQEIAKLFFGVIDLFQNKDFKQFFQNINSKKPKEAKIIDDNDTTKDIFETIFFVLICIVAIRFFIGELRWIPSDSMNPTLIKGDRLYVEKLKFPKKEVQRGDILVFYPPSTRLSNSPVEVIARLTGIACKDIAYIKRLIGMPGEKFEVKFNPETKEYRVYINDKPINEPYIMSKTEWTPCNQDMLCGPLVIPEGYYFMMGDNRGNSADSRFWGVLDKNRVIGRANFMFFPFKRINVLKDKYLLLHEEKIDNQTKEKKYIVNRYEFLYKI